MFLFTVTKPAVRQMGALAVCVLCLAGTVAATVKVTDGGSLAVGAEAEHGIETTQDIA